MGVCLLLCQIANLGLGQRRVGNRSHCEKMKVRGLVETVQKLPQPNKLSHEWGRNSAHSYAPDTVNETTRTKQLKNAICYSARVPACVALLLTFSPFSTGVFAIGCTIGY